MLTVGEKETACNPVRKHKLGKSERVQQGIRAPTRYVSLPATLDPTKSPAHTGLPCAARVLITSSKFELPVRLDSD